ncbi:hypothetical protein ACFSJY_14605 [Thalassotalea euphylliae]|uniref:pyroglutamyl-peptidase I family protein n=1 Tax=Thalassotalea euphylliae TaxID=1655234 RepID=UPI003644CA75
MPFFALGKSATYFTVEEARIEKANEANPVMFSVHNDRVQAFEQSLKTIETLPQLESIVVEHGKRLFKQAVENIQSSQSYDDRALYWTRLQMTKLIRANETYRKLDDTAQNALMFAFELASRGVGQTGFGTKTDKKILITGFDPFFLDRNIEQSNPSGIAAMMLDNKVISHQGKTAEIQSLMVPVRFVDFDQGIIETMLTEHFAHVDMIATISMGREDFDLERFPGLRRSAKAPGNLNVYTGASSEQPLVPFLRGEILSGPEFVEFSLPVEAMQKATGPYKVIDNHKVETLQKGKFEAKSLDELANSTSVNGSGGGYLSNEISYRSILLRNALKPNLPVGHIHTPRIKEWKKAEVKGIVDQIEGMLKQAIPVI